MIRFSERRSARLEQRDKLKREAVRNIELCAAAFEGLYEVVENVSLEDTLNDLEQRTITFFQKVDDETLERHDQLQELKQELIELGKKGSSLKKLDLLNEIRTLENDKGVLLMGQVLQVLENLQHRAHDVENIRRSPELQRKLLERYVGPDDPTAELRFGAYSVDIIADKPLALFANGRLRALGRHIYRSPVNIILRRDEYETMRTREHELVHTITDGSYLRGADYTYSTTRIQMILAESTRERLKEAEGDDTGSDELMGTIAANEFWLESTSVDDLLFGLKDELLAHTRTAESRTTHRYTGEVYSSLSNRNAARPMWSIATMSTAGNEVGKLLNLFKQFEGTLATPELNRHVTRLRNGLETRIQGILNQMDKATHFGTLLGPEVHTFVHASLIALEPKQYHHIPTFLTERFGKDAVQSAEQVLEALKTFEGSLSQVRTLVTFIEQHPGTEDEALFFAAGQVLMDLAGGGDMLNHSHEWQVSEVEEYANAVLRFANLLQDESESWREKVWYHTYFTTINQIALNPETSTAILENRDGEQETAVQQAADILLSSTEFLIYTLSQTGRLEEKGVEGIKDEPIWEIMRELGKANEFERMLHQELEYIKQDKAGAT